MKIALIGYGKMGRLVHDLAKEKGHSIVATIDSKTTLNSPAAKQAVSLADVCIDFSTPHTVLENVKILSSMKKNIVMGTTGWDCYVHEIKDIIAKSDTGFISSPNFSIGVALYLRMIEQSAELMASFDQYKVAGTEIHHSTKQDAPSGTSKAIAKKLNKHLSRAVSFTSIREGDVPGTHSIEYNSPIDSITLTHTAHNREGFAHGALIAAQWLNGKKGIFTQDDLLDGLLS